MVHWFVEGRETVRRATVPGQVYLPLLLPGSLGKPRPEMGASRTQEDPRTKDEHLAPKRPPPGRQSSSA